MREENRMTSPGLEEALTDPRTEEIFRRMREQNAIGHKGCPWCGDIPVSASLSHGMYLLGCENEFCPVEPKVCARTLKEAFEKWDTRAEPEPAGISEPGALK